MKNIFNFEINSIFTLGGDETRKSMLYKNPEIEKYKMADLVLNLDKRPYQKNL